MVEQFLTAGDLFPRVPAINQAVRALRNVPVERALDWVAQLFASMALPGNQWKQRQHQLAREWFTSTVEGLRARDLVLSGERRLCAPHILIRLARLALLHSSRTPAGDHETEQQVGYYGQQMITAMLIVGHQQSSANITAAQLELPTGADLDAPFDAIELEMAANLLSNHRFYAPSTFHRSERRWIEIPDADASSAAINLAAEYEAATGVLLNDLRVIGIALWSKAFGSDGPRIRPEQLEQLGLTPERISAVLDLISASIEDLTKVANKKAAGDYDASLFGQWPLIRLFDGQLLIFNPEFLIERTLGWIPRWDLTNGFQKQGKTGTARASQAVGYLRKTTETHAVETLEALAATARRSAMVYTENDIQNAYSTRKPNADAAINWDGHWIVAEISARPVMRGTAAGGSAKDLLTDLRLGILSKAEQLHETIAAIRRDETKLVGTVERLGGMTFTPVLVTAEGFPVTPMMTMRIRAMLKKASYLQGPDTAPIVVVDIDGLEVAEAIAESGGPELPKLLTEHQRSQLSLYAFRDWLLWTYGSRQAPRRIMRSWDRMMKPIIDQLVTSERNST